MSSASLLSDLARHIEGEVTDAPDAIALASGDYGQLVRKEPRAVVRPRSAADVARAVKYAFDHDLPVSPRAGGYSFGGQALNEGGLVIDMRALASIRGIDPEQMWIDADAGASWVEALKATLPRSLVPPVLTAYHRTTLGGTLSAGGFGMSTFRHGTQVDGCVELEIVTGTGEIVRCSAEENADLFLHALAGYGQFGVLTRVKQRLRRFRPRARTYFLLYDDLGALLEDQERLAREARVDFIDAMIAPFFQGHRVVDGCLAPLTNFMFPMNITTEMDVNDPEPARDDAVLDGLRFYRLAHVEDTPTADFIAIGHDDERRPSPRIAYVFIDLLLPWSVTRRFIEATLERLGSLVNVEHLLLWPALTGTLTRPMVPRPDEPMMMGFGVYARVPKPHGEKALAACRKLIDLAFKMGGNLYPSGSVRLDAARWRQQLRGAFHAARAAKRRYDPKGLMNPGFIPFDAAELSP